MTNMRPDINGQGLSLSALLFALIVLLGSVVFVACEEDEEEGQPAEVKVVATLDLFANFARQVGGERVDVSTLIPAGADPHTYEPTPSRVAELTKADLVIMNGLDLEAGLEDVIEENISSSAILVELAEGLSAIDENPHLWLDVQYAMAYVERIRDALMEIDPAGAETYRVNTDSYLVELQALDEEVAAAINSIPWNVSSWMEITETMEEFLIVLINSPAIGGRIR